MMNQGNNKGVFDNKEGKKQHKNNTFGSVAPSTGEHLLCLLMHIKLHIF